MEGSGALRHAAVPSVSTDFIRRSQLEVLRDIQRLLFGWTPIWGTHLLISSGGTTLMECSVVIVIVVALLLFGPALVGSRGRLPALSGLLALLGISLPALAGTTSASIVVHSAHVRARSSFPLSARLYPAHTRITTVDPLSNQRMDCDWGFACHGDQPVTSAPVFHLRTQDDLHRLSGWAQFGDRHGHTTRMLFAVYASRYTGQSAEGMPWNVMAFADFRGALMAEGYEDLNHVPRLLPKGAVGNTSAQLIRSLDGDVYALSCWTGSIEVEGVVIYAHGSPPQTRLARSDLSRQIRTAVRTL